MYSRVVFILNSLWCHCYCCFLLMKSKCEGFFSIDKKKKYWPASKSYSSWRPISKANKLFCFVSFFFSWILVLFFLFFSLIYFILLFFFCGRARPFYRLPVKCYDTVNIWQFFINHISVKEMQMKFMQRKIINVYVFVIECILHRELIMNEKKFLKDIYDQRC